MQRSWVLAGMKMDLYRVRCSMSVTSVLVPGIEDRRLQVKQRSALSPLREPHDS